jgi:hypothetical protein
MTAEELPKGGGGTGLFDRSGGPPLTMYGCTRRFGCFGCDRCGDVVASIVTAATADVTWPMTPRRFAITELELWNSLSLAASCSTLEMVGLAYRGTTASLLVPRLPGVLGRASDA